MGASPCNLSEWRAWRHHSERPFLDPLGLEVVTRFGPFGLVVVLPQARARGGRSDGQPLAQAADSTLRCLVVRCRPLKRAPRRSASFLCPPLHASHRVLRARFADHPTPAAVRAAQACSAPTRLFDDDDDEKLKMHAPTNGHRGNFPKQNGRGKSTPKMDHQKDCHPRILCHPD